MFNANLVYAFFFCLSLLSLFVCACGVCARTALVIMCWLTSLPLCKRETTSSRSFPRLHRICAFLCVKARGFHGPVSFIQICKQVGGKHDFSSFFFISETRPMDGRCESYWTRESTCTHSKGLGSSSQTKECKARVDGIK